MDALSRWDLPVIDTTYADCLARAQWPSAIYRIDCRWPMPLYVYVKNDGRPVTFVSFAAALPADVTTLPYFLGAHIAEDMNVVMVSDPVLALPPMLKVAWYAGAKGIDLQARLPGLLDHLCQRLGGSTIYSGASAGGFAALYYGLMGTADALVVMNPQTVVLDYMPRRFVEAYAKQAFGSVNALEKEACTDLRTVWGRVVPITYLQNIGDGHHVEKHLKPLLDHAGLPYAVTGIDRPAFRLILGDWGDGHRSPPRPVIREALQRAARLLVSG